LLGEIEQILRTNNLELQRDREILKSVRQGEWSLERIEEYFRDQEQKLESLYHSSSLPYAPDEQKIKSLLLECLEMHYGSIDTMIQISGRAKQTISKIDEIVRLYKEGR
jgi:hypothetical protein